MSRIVGAEVLPYALPLTAAWRTAGGERLTREGALLVLATEEGTEGLGEAAPLADRSEPLEACLATLGRAAEMLRAERPPVEEALGLLEGSIQGFGSAPDDARAARAAVAVAAFDLLSKAEGRPLAGWLADRLPGAGPPADRVPVNAVLPTASPARTAKEARRAADRGFRCLKLKVGWDAARDLARARAAREAAGEDTALRLDANGAWTPEEALRRLEMLAAFGIEYVEQPLAACRREERADALDALAALRRASPVRIAADESASDAEGARSVVQAGAADVLVLKPAVLGGPDVALALAREALGAGMEVVVTSALDGIVGRLAALHTAAALGPGVPACGLATGRFLAHELAEGEERLERGALHVPAMPGLGARRRRAGIRGFAG